MLLQSYIGAPAVVGFAGAFDAVFAIVHLLFWRFEDFGRFGSIAPAAMFFLGAGEDHPRLHNPDYDFPDDLIDIGARVFMRALRSLLG